VHWRWRSAGIASWSSENLSRRQQLTAIYPTILIVVAPFRSSSQSSGAALQRARGRGGTPFAFQLDEDGKPSQPFAAYRRLDTKGASW
jgi:hypothetical protein